MTNGHDRTLTVQERLPGRRYADDRGSKADMSLAFNWAICGRLYERFDSERS